MARWALIPLSLLGACVCARWAEKLYGPKAGLLAAALWCFSPNLLAHGALITPDAGATALGLTACYLFWRWLRGPSWRAAALAGLALGVAELTKSTWIVLFALWPLLWPAYRWEGVVPRLRLPEGGQVLLVLSLGLFVLNLGYGFNGSFRRLRDYEFVSPTFTGSGEYRGITGNRFRDSWLGGLPVPVPANYLRGIDRQTWDFDHGMRSYLRGEWRHGGWWYYYLYALLIKVPLGTWALAVLALLARWTARRPAASRWKDEMVLLAPALVVLVLVSSHTGFNHHLRYVLPAVPFALIWISQLGEQCSFRQKPAASVLIASALLWSIGSSLWISPHSLSYFNELAGGPTGGHAHLVNSNIDWGQDLLYLRDWLREHPEARPLGLAYFGHVDPRLAGIESTLPPPAPLSGVPVHPASDMTGPRPGWYAVSVSLLRGEVYSAPGPAGRRGIGGGDYTYFLHFQPVDRAGYSISIYHVTPVEAERVRREMAGERLNSTQHVKCTTTM
ncbi:MAG: glycosyltransferase family 39 protein [Planctomycetaceae bacterium]